MTDPHIEELFLRPDAGGVYQATAGGLAQGMCSDGHIHDDNLLIRAYDPKGELIHVIIGQQVFHQLVLNAASLDGWIEVIDIPGGGL